METAARRVPEAYLRYPEAHRPEDLEAAARLDVLLEELWRDHPAYAKVEGTPDIEEKVARALEVIRGAWTGKDACPTRGGEDDTCTERPR